jgi:hypothetical protein
MTEMTLKPVLEGHTCHRRGCHCHCPPECTAPKLGHVPHVRETFEPIAPRSPLLNAVLWLPETVVGWFLWLLVPGD